MPMSMVPLVVGRFVRIRCRECCCLMMGLIELGVAMGWVDGVYFLVSDVYLYENYQIVF